MDMESNAPVDSQETTEQPSAPAEVEPVVAEKPAEAPDYKALYEKETQRRKSLEGSVGKQRERDAVPRRTQQLLEALFDHLSNPDADPQALKTRKAEIDAQEVQVVSAEQFNVRSEKLRASINRKLAAFELSPATEPRLTEAFNLWRDAGARSDFDALLDASAIVDSIVADHAGNTRKRATTAEAEVEKTRKAKKADELNLDSGRSAARTGPRNLATLDTRGMSLKELQEVDKEIEAALRGGR